MDNVPKETHVVSVMTHMLLETVAKFRDEKDDRLLLHPNSKAKQTHGEKGDKEESSDKRSQIVCRYRNCKNPSYEFWHLPAC